MNNIITNLPIVKVSDLQKNLKKVVQEVKKEGYRYVINRGNMEIVMISLPLFREAVAGKQTSAKKHEKEKSLFAEWKGKSWKKILGELRKEDGKKPLDIYLKELIEWQKQLLS